jgi:hypothetical protein
MVVDQTDGLHERIADGRTHELEAAREQRFAQRSRFVARNRYVARRFRRIDDRRSIDERPHPPIERPMLACDLKKGSSIRNGREHFRAVSNDSGVSQRFLDRGGAHARDALRFEVVKDRAISFPFAQDGIPAQTCLCAFEGDELEQSAIVVQRNAPLAIVVADHVFASGPSTTRPVVHAASHSSLRRAGPAR